jgi:hypothetical protein
MLGMMLKKKVMVWETCLMLNTKKLAFWLDTSSPLSELVLVTLTSEQLITLQNKRTAFTGSFG